MNKWVTTDSTNDIDSTLAQERQLDANFGKTGAAGCRRRTWQSTR